MRDINKVILVGRLGGDPVLHETKNGKIVTTFSLATSRKYREEGGDSPVDGEMGGEQGVSVGQLKETTQWHRVVAWGKRGEHCAQYLKKGHAVFVEGSLRSHKYAAKDGTEKTAFEVHAENVSFLTGAGKAKTALNSLEQVPA